MESCLCFINCSVNYKSFTSLESYLVLNWVFSVLNSFLSLLKVGFVFFLICEKKSPDTLNYCTTKVFLEISQNLQENTWARVCFLIKLHA